MEQSGNRLEGVLEKKSRGRSFIVFNNWQVRHFILEKQNLAYYNPKDLQKPIGNVSTKDATIKKLSSEDAEGRKFAFVVTTLAPDENEAESFILSADSEASRTKWMNYLYASSRSENWSFKATTVLKKSGQDISTALLAKSKAQENNIDDAASILLDTISSGFRKKKFEDEMAQLERSLKIVDAEGVEMTPEQKATNKNKLHKMKDIAKERFMATKIQSFLRRRIAYKRRYMRMYFMQSVLMIQTHYRRILALKRKRRLIIEKSSYRIIAKLVCKFIARRRELLRQYRTGNLFTVEVSSAAGLVSKSVASNVYVYTMACYDDSKRFKGKDENNIKNGYGLKCTSLFKGMPIPYSHDPDWEDNDIAVTVDTTSNCYFVLTLMAYDTLLGKDSFIGQAIVGMGDVAPNVRSTVGDPSVPAYRRNKIPTVRDELYAGNEVVFRDYPLRKYVAPVEDTEGVAKVVLNVALQVSNVTGTITFKIKYQPAVKSICTPLVKETNAIAAACSRDLQWKPRIFALAEGHLIYAKNKSGFGFEPKHTHKLSKCVECRVDYYEKGDPKSMQLVMVFKENKIAKPKTWTIRWPPKTPMRERKEFIRKLYRNMPHLVDPDPENQKISALRENSGWVDNAMIDGAFAFMASGRSGKSSGKYSGRNSASSKPSSSSKKE